MNSLVMFWKEVKNLIWSLRCLFPTKILHEFSLLHLYSDECLVKFLKFLCVNFIEEAKLKQISQFSETNFNKSVLKTMEALDKGEWNLIKSKNKTREKHLWEQKWDVKLCVISMVFSRVFQIFRNYVKLSFYQKQL